MEKGKERVKGGMTNDKLPQDDMSNVRLYETVTSSSLIIIFNEEKGATG